MTTAEKWVLRVGIGLAMAGIIWVFVMGTQLILSFKETDRVYDRWKARCTAQEGTVYHLDEVNKLICISGKRVVMERDW